MAIQHRRGVYDHFDPTRLVAGEWAVVLSGDGSASDGRAVYICFAAGTVKRMATYEDMAENIANVNEQIIVELTRGVAELEGAVADAEEARAAAEAARAGSEDGRASSETARAQAEAARAAAETGRASAEAERVIEFAQMRTLANGWLIHHCTEGEYDASTGRPVVADPDPGTLYCVPTGDAGDPWEEWRYDEREGGFEHVGTTQANLEGIPTSSIDSIFSGTAETGTEVLQTTGLSYLVGRVKAWAEGAFAGTSHVHAAATAQSPGFMSAADKAKLDGVDAGARAYAAMGAEELAEGHSTVARTLSAKVLADYVAGEIGAVADGSY